MQNPSAAQGDFDAAAANVPTLATFQKRSCCWKVLYVFGGSCFFGKFGMLYPYILMEK